MLALPPVRRLMLFMWTFPALAVVPEALAVPYVMGRPGGTALGAGLLLTAVPAGTFAGEALATSLASPSWQTRMVRAATALLFVPLLGFAAQPGVAVAIAALVASGLGNAAMPGLDRITIEVAPDDLLPRTLSIQSAGLMFWVGIGYVAAGGLAQFLRPGYVIALAGCCGLVVVGVLAPGKPAGAGRGIQDTADADRAARRGAGAERSLIFAPPAGWTCRTGFAGRGWRGTGAIPTSGWGLFRMAWQDAPFLLWCP